MELLQLRKQQVEVRTSQQAPPPRSHDPQVAPPTAEPVCVGSSGPAGSMFDWSRRWNLSLAGCGFSSVYYLGALACFLDRVPRLVHGASRVCGASSGCLVAAAVAVGIPLGEFQRKVPVQTSPKHLQQQRDRCWTAGVNEGTEGQRQREYTRERSGGQMWINRQVH